MDVVLMGLLTPEKPWRRHSAADRRAAREALKQMGIDALARRKIVALSGGQRQRVFIARALVSHPELMLLDEPTASIDAGGQAEFFNILKELNKEVTILVVSHDLMVISRYAKSVACVNRTLYYHDEAEITEEMLNTMYPCLEGEEVCPVELVAHGLPHRVLQKHDKTPQRKTE
jgi:zinc transport system ATP-binding protein